MGASPYSCSRTTVHDTPPGRTVTDNARQLGTARTAAMPTFRRDSVMRVWPPSNRSSSASSAASQSANSWGTCTLGLLSARRAPGPFWEGPRRSAVRPEAGGVPEVGPLPGARSCDVNPTGPALPAATVARAAAVAFRGRSAAGELSADGPAASTADGLLDQPLRHLGELA